jgi:hypothetical protein
MRRYLAPIPKNPALIREFRGHEQLSGMSRRASTVTKYRRNLPLLRHAQQPGEPVRRRGRAHLRAAGESSAGNPRFNYLITDAWKGGLTARAFSGKYLVGDESNLNPKTGPYVVVNLSTSYAI